MPDGECMAHVRPGTKHKTALDDNGKSVGAHVIVYEHYNGPVPEGHVVRHTCDNPPCCKREHLVSGTHKQNSEDMIDRGRNVHGEDRWNSKLSNEDTLRLKAMLVSKEYRQNDLAKLFGVSEATVSEIKHDKARQYVHP